MAILKLPSGRFRLQIRRRGLRVDELCDTEQQAKEKQREYLAGREAGLKLPDAWKLYIDSPGYLQKRERTRNTEAGRIKRFLNEWTNRTVQSLTPADVEQYIASRLKEKPAPSADAIRLEVAALSALCNYCRKLHFIPTNPCLGVERPAATVKPRRMLPEELGSLTALLRHPNLRFRSVARLCLLVRETGARPGEWQQVKLTDIDLDQSRVVFQRTKYRNQPRTVPLTQAAVRLIEEQVGDLAANGPWERTLITEFLFPAEGKDGAFRPMHYTGALRDAKKKNLLPRSVKGHTGRHEFISELVESTDMEDSRIMALVGHHSPASMEVYKHIRNARLLPQVESIEGKRRVDRARALAKALGVPPQVIVSVLHETRRREKRRGRKDEGDELLYTRKLQKELGAMVDLLGSSPAERYSALIRMRAAQAMGKSKAGRPKKASGKRGRVASEEAHLHSFLGLPKPLRRLIVELEGTSDSKLAEAVDGAGKP